MACLILSYASSSLTSSLHERERETGKGDGQEVARREEGREEGRKRGRWHRVTRRRECSESALLRLPCTRRVCVCFCM